MAFTGSAAGKHFCPEIPALVVQVAPKPANFQLVDGLAIGHENSFKIKYYGNSYRKHLPAEVVRENSARTSVCKCRTPYIKRTAVTMVVAFCVRHRKNGPGTLFSTILIVLGISAGLFFTGCCIYSYLNSGIPDPDGIARITGPCGDTMEIALKFNGSCIEDVHCWSSGCSISRMCVATIGMLARGKTVPELLKIDMHAVLQRIGNLPETHIHCALLAETTLHKAVENYQLKIASGK